MSSAAGHEAFHEQLVRHGLILPSGVPGVWARSEVFESVLQRFDDRVHDLAVADGAERLHFSPLIPRQLLERTGYLDSFPHLAGTVFSFTGTEPQARELGRRAKAGEPWAELQTQTDVALTPAACYPVYPTLRGLLREESRTLEVIRVGRPESVLGWRAAWLDRSLALLGALGLDARAVHASDPFFGRAG